MKAEDGSLYNMDASLSDAKIKDMQHVWVVLKGADPSGHQAQTLLGSRRPLPTVRMAGHLDDGTELKPKPAAPKY